MDLIKNNNKYIEGFNNDTDPTLSMQLYTVGKNGEVLVVLVMGYIDTNNYTFFQKQMNKILFCDYAKIILDASHISYISSTGIGSFIEFLKSAKKENKTLVFTNFQDRVKEVFNLLGFMDFFVVKADVDASLEYLNGLSSAPAKADVNTSTASQNYFLVSCPNCDSKLKVPNKKGTFKCGKCNFVFKIDDSGKIT